MRIKLKINAVHYGKPLEIDIDAELTAKEMVQLHREMPETMKAIRKMNKKG